MHLFLEERRAELSVRVSRAMVVGPALVKANLIQQSKTEKRMPLGRTTAFRDVHVAPP